jgi:hypothetical protein
MNESFMRQIFVTAGATGSARTNSCLEIVSNLCVNNNRVRRQLFAHMAKPYTGDIDYQVPSLFQLLTTQLTTSNNAHYKQAIIVWFMLFDPACFGSYMLHGESDLVRETFMKKVLQATASFVVGVKLDGELFTERDSIFMRTAGHFICDVRSTFVSV